MPYIAEISGVYIDEEDADEWGHDACNLCGDTGIIVDCIDDLCRGAGECMHGDGERLCPNGCDPY